MGRDLVTVEGRFKPASSAGHSLEEIRSAARTFGLDLLGVKAPATEWTLRRPAIVFLGKGGHGHFVVIRPVGHSGHLVQVIDGGHSLETLDYARLVADPSWTGLALVPARTSFDWRLLNAAIAFASVSAWLGIRAFWAPRESRRASDPLAVADSLG